MSTDITFLITVILIVGLFVYQTIKAFKYKKDNNISFGGLTNEQREDKELKRKTKKLKRDSILLTLAIILVIIILSQIR